MGISELINTWSAVTICIAVAVVALYGIVQAVRYAYSKLYALFAFKERERLRSIESRFEQLDCRFNKHIDELTIRIDRLEGKFYNDTHAEREK